MLKNFYFVFILHLSDTRGMGNGLSNGSIHSRLRRNILCVVCIWWSTTMGWATTRILWRAKCSQARAKNGNDSTSWSNICHCLFLNIFFFCLKYWTKFRLQLQATIQQLYPQIHLMLGHLHLLNMATSFKLIFKNLAFNIPSELKLSEFPFFTLPTIYTQSPSRQSNKSYKQSVNGSKDLNTSAGAQDRKTLQQI